MIVIVRLLILTVLQLTLTFFLNKTIVVPHIIKLPIFDRISSKTPKTKQIILLYIVYILQHNIMYRLAITKMSICLNQYMDELSCHGETLQLIYYSDWIHTNLFFDKREEQ